jgi:hypothetical protein
LCSTNKTKKNIKISSPKPIQSIYQIKISSNEFVASYTGPDFANGEDIAHQLSNFVADTLGKYLKAEYKKGAYKKIDFEKTKIQTLKNHPDSVYFTIQMPLLNASNCEAFTCVDHRGSWVHNTKKTDNDLKDFLASIRKVENHKEEIKLFQTTSGYYEYWVQFRHPIIQETCK